MNIDSLPSITIGKFRWWGTNHHELVGIKNEIFHQQIYSLPSNFNLLTSNPTIIDAGAHVGIATLYFKLHYPQATIVCLEPHPLSVHLLKHNLWFNRINNVEVIEAALADHDGPYTLYADNTPDMWLSTTGRSGAWDGQQTTSPLTVNGITLDRLLSHPVDLLKMDIEGAELAVLKHSRKLNMIQQILLELHPPISPSQIKTILSHTHTLTISPHHFGLKLLHANKI